MSSNELIQINKSTGEILLPCENQEDAAVLKHAKIKAVNLLAQSDFVRINGVWEAKRDGLIKILSSLPLSYSWEIKNTQLTDTYAKVEGLLCVSTGSIVRKADSVGICEFTELSKGGLHFMITRAETRALKRSIEVLFGSVINYYVVRYLE